MIEAIDEVMDSDKSRIFQQGPALLLQSKMKILLLQPTADSFSFILLRYDHIDFERLCALNVCRLNI